RGASEQKSEDVGRGSLRAPVSAQLCRFCPPASGGVGLSIGFAGRRPRVRIPHAPSSRISHLQEFPALRTKSEGLEWAAAACAPHRAAVHGLTRKPSERPLASPVGGHECALRPDPVRWAYAPVPRTMRQVPVPTL